MSVQGFFGLKVVPGKKYSQIVEHSFRITMASLADVAKNNSSRAALHIKVDDNDFILCSLTPGKVDQQLLDLVVAKNEEIVFSVDGQHTIHLTGNYLFDDDEESDEEISSEDEAILDGEDEDLLNNVPEGVDRAKVLAYLNGELDSDDMMSDSDEELDEARIQEIEEDEEDEDEEDEEEEEEAPKPLTKKEKKAAAAAKEEKPLTKKEKKAAAAVKEEAPKEEKPLTKKEKKAAAAAEKEQAANQEKKRGADTQKEEPTKKQKTEEKKPKQQEKKVTKMANGLIIEDVKVGEGANVKSGARIGMRYIGKLTNGKVFDKNTSGKPFNFMLGRGEVIKGWDQGILGMKLGGERKLTIPAPLAYGKRGAPPQIPGNATLVFDIKLVSMK